MKKLILIFALVAVYGISISNVSAKVITVEKSQVTVVADMDDNTVTSLEKDDKKDTKKKKADKATVKEAPAKACCGTAAKTTDAKTGCSEAAKKSCAAAGKTCGGAKEKK